MWREERMYYVRELNHNKYSTNYIHRYEGMDWHAKQAFIAMKQKQMLKKEKEEQEEEIVEAVQANIVIKADTQGSLDSIRAAIETFPQEKVKLNVLQTMVGNVAKSDVFKAESFEASIFAFNVNANKSTKKAAEKSNVNLFTYDVIYSLLDGVKDFMVSRLDPLVEEKLTGSADVLQVIPLGNGKVMAAGCRVEKGTWYSSAKRENFNHVTHLITHFCCHKYPNTK